MAEVSSSTLHNIGNVLNNLSIGAQHIDALLDDIEPKRLDSVANLIETQGLLSQHPKSAIIPEYLRGCYKSIHSGTSLIRRSVKDSLRQLRLAGDAIRNSAKDNATGRTFIHNQETV